MKVDMVKRCSQLRYVPIRPANCGEPALVRSVPTYGHGYDKPELFCLEHAERDDVIIETGHVL